MIKIGNYNRLLVIKSLDFGMYLTDKDATLEILLPIKYIKKDTQIGDWITVFVYNDNENRPIATTLEAYAEVGDFAFLKIVDENETGAFIDLGIAKDVLVPYREQKSQLQKGKKGIFYIYFDEKSSRIAATAKWEKYIKDDIQNLQEKDEVSLLISDQTDLGFKAIINNKYLGLIYHNEIFENLQIGDIKKGFIKKIRPENKIDLSLQIVGYQHIEQSKNIILEKLYANDGVLNFGDKSTPDEINSFFGISKKAFKKMIGSLYREKLIEMDENQIRIIKK